MRDFWTTISTNKYPAGGIHPCTSHPCTSLLAGPAQASGLLASYCQSVLPGPLPAPVCSLWFYPGSSVFGLTLTSAGLRVQTSRLPPPTPGQVVGHLPADIWLLPWQFSRTSGGDFRGHLAAILADIWRKFSRTSGRNFRGHLAAIFADIWRRFSRTSGGNIRGHLAVPFTDIWQFSRTFQDIWHHQTS